VPQVFSRSLVEGMLSTLTRKANSQMVQVILSTMKSPRNCLATGCLEETALKTLACFRGGRLRAAEGRGALAFLPKTRGRACELPAYPCLRALRAETFKPLIPDFIATRHDSNVWTFAFGGQRSAIPARVKGSDMPP